MERKFGGATFDAAIVIGFYITLLQHTTTIFTLQFLIHTSFLIVRRVPPPQRGMPHNFFMQQSKRDFGRNQRTILGV